MIEIYTTPHCPYCIRAKSLLDERNLAYEEIPVDGRPNIRAEMIERSGRFTVPQIFIHGVSIGGCTELMMEMSDETFDLRLTSR